MGHTQQSRGGIVVYTTKNTHDTQERRTTGGRGKRVSGCKHDVYGDAVVTDIWRDTGALLVREGASFYIHLTGECHHN